ncbi:MAG: chromosome segregation protein SMC [Cyclobacteriaceae bacterium]
MEENKSRETVVVKSDPKPKNRAPIITGVLVILLATIFFFVWKNMELEEERVRQDQEIADTYLKLDSVSTELDLRIETITELGGEIDTLVALKAQLEDDKKNLLVRQKNQRTQITKLNERVSGYRELLLIKDQEIEELKVLNVKLVEENTTLKVEKNELNQSITKLQQNTEELASKVAVASRLQIEGLAVYAVNDSGKERLREFRNRHINTLKIQFTVLDNEIAPIEGKELLLRVTAPDGNVLFDVTRGSGSFTFEGRELFYTAKQEILYDKNSQLVTYQYDKGSDYDIGQHKVEVYTDDYLMGVGMFMVK